jgi:hypothetical protein
MTSRGSVQNATAKKKKKKEESAMSVLINDIIDLVTSYNSLRVTPSAHCDEFFTKQKLGDPHTEEFMREIFYGLERHGQMLDLTVDGFYEAGLGVSRDDRDRLRILALITCTSLGDMEWEDFVELILSQQPVTVHSVLSFLFHEEQIGPDGWLANQWALVYDANYVEAKLLRVMRRFAEPVGELLVELGALAAPPDEDGKSRRPTKKKKVTVPQPFNLTRPTMRPFAGPTVEFDSSAYRAQPVPDSVYATSLADVERQKLERKQKFAEQSLKKMANIKEYSFQKADRESRDRLVEQVLREEAESMKHFKAKPVPEAKPSDIQWKPTTASILRTEKVIRERQKEEADRLLEYSRTMVDDSNFKKWQAQMRDKDEEEKAELVKARKEDLAKATEHVIKAVKKKEAEKREVVVGMREELEEIIKQKKIEDADTMAVKRLQKEAIKALRPRVGIVQEKIKKEKQAQVREMIDKREREKKQIARQRAVELKKKKEFIQEIIALEKLTNQKAKRPKEYDPTVGSSIGVLGEMTAAELKDRLALMKNRTKEQELRMREKIKQDKLNKREVIAAMERKHAKLNRIQMAEADVVRRAAREKSAKDNQAKEEQQTVNDRIVQKKLAAKKTARESAALKIAMEYQQRKQEVDFAEAGRMRMAKSRAQDLKRAEARRERDYDRRRAEAKMLDARINAADHVAHMRTQKQAARELVRKKKASKEKARVATEDANRFIEEDMQHKLEQVAEMRAYRQAAIEKVRKAKPYETKVAQKRVSKLKRTQALQLAQTLKLRQEAKAVVR